MRIKCCETFATNARRGCPAHDSHRSNAERRLAAGVRGSHVWAYLRTPSTEMIRSTVCDAGPRSILMSKSFRVRVVLPSKPAR